MRLKPSTAVILGVDPLSDHLEADGPLTLYDYEFLKGNTVFWKVPGAALNVVYEWCKNRGYGAFGAPSDTGRARMKEFEMMHKDDPT